MKKWSATPTTRSTVGDICTNTNIKTDNSQGPISALTSDRMTTHFTIAIYGVWVKFAFYKISPFHKICKNYYHNSQSQSTCTISSNWISAFSTIYKFFIHSNLELLFSMLTNKIWINYLIYIQTKHTVIACFLQLLHVYSFAPKQVTEL